jgi:hypothetical protein
VLPESAHSAVGYTDTIAGSNTVTALRKSPAQARRSLSYTYLVSAGLVQFLMDCTGRTDVDQATALIRHIVLDILHSDRAARTGCWDHIVHAVPAGTDSSDIGTTSC